MESRLKPQHTLHVSSSSLTNATSKLISLISSHLHISIDYFLTNLPIALLTHKIPYQSSIPNLLKSFPHTLNKIQSHYQHPHGPEYMIWCLRTSSAHSFSTPSILAFYNSSNMTSMLLCGLKTKCHLSYFCHLLSDQLHSLAKLNESSSVESVWKMSFADF